jgi:truncated hemoglobin YjbI
METETTKKTGAGGEAKTGKKEDSLMKMCMSCCGDMVKMEDMRKMMKDRCAGMPIPEEMRKKWMDCCQTEKQK